MKVLNLDAIKNDDKKVLLNGKEYTIPGDLPVMLMLRLLDNSGKIQENPSNLEHQEEAFNLLTEAFKIKNSAVDSEKLKDSLSMAQYTKLVAFIFGQGEAVAEPEKKQNEGQQEEQPDDKTNSSTA